MIRHIIFDLDGTLSDSALLTCAALQIEAPLLGLPVVAAEQVRRATGFPNPQFYELLYPEQSVALVRQLGERVERRELQLLQQLGDRLLFRGCEEMLRELSSQGIQGYLASTGHPEHVQAILQATGIGQYFRTVRCGQPDKSQMLSALISNRHDEGWLMVGDMSKDYLAARANRIASVGACWGYCRRSEGGFCYYADTPKALLRLAASLEAGTGVVNRMERRR